MDEVEPQHDLVPRIQVPSTALICNETLRVESKVAHILGKIYIYFFSVNTLQWKLIAKAEFPGTGQTVFSSDQQGWLVAFGGLSSNISCH